MGQCAELRRARTTNYGRNYGRNYAVNYEARGTTELRELRGNYEMATKKLPSYVEAVESDGRRVFKDEFKAGVVADIRSGRTTVAEVAEKFHLSRAMIYQWLNKNRQGKYPSRVPRTTEPSENGKTLLEQALEANVEELQPQEKSDAIDQSVELALAFLSDKISEARVRAALKIEKRFHLDGWLGRVFVGALRNGWELKKK